MANSNEQNIAAIPESITIGGTTYSVKDTPELQLFIQSVAKVEKSKLYTQFETLRKQINDLKDVRVEPSNAPSDVTQLRKEITQDVVNSLLPEIKKVTEIVQPVLAATQRSAKEELDSYREKIISQNLAVCIPDLVKGNTKEELDASLQDSIRLRASYPSANTVYQNGRVVDPLIEQQLNDMNSSQQEQLPPKTIRQVPVIPAADESSQGKSAKSMSIQEFSQKRDQLLNELTSTYAEGSLGN